jgi:hypothetical protein
MTQPTPHAILKRIHRKATHAADQTVIADPSVRNRVEYVCHCLSNRAGVRLLMACLLGKLHTPEVDPRKPYTEIGTQDCFSGRTYDEQYITPFITEHRLPCNPTTAFLTPTLRNINHALTCEQELIGRPRDLYRNTLQTLNDVAEKRIDAETVFIETVRILLQLRDEKLGRISSLVRSLKHAKDALPLSSEAIIDLVRQHLACKNTSRLPVLIIAAAYQAAEQKLSEQIRPLNAHNAADRQTGSLGDIEVRLANDSAVITAYEMKTRRITVDDIDAAITKIARTQDRINNYIFITTDKIDPDVAEYAARFYEDSAGIEIAILDCLAFLRHFLHLFHRIRTEYLNIYQDLVLKEPDSAVSQALKEAFLTLRQAAETGE